MFTQPTKTKHALALVLLCGAVSATTSLHAQLPVSRPAGALPIAVAGPLLYTPLAIPFTQEPVVRDVVSLVAGQDITGSTAYTAGAFNPNSFGTTHILVVVTGVNRGRGLSIVSNDASKITVLGAVPALTTADEFEVVQLPTLNSVFGGVANGGPFNLTGGSNQGNSDNLIIGTSTYFYKTTGPIVGWKLSTDAPTAADRGTTAIQNLRGVTVFRRGAATTVALRGVVRSNVARIPVPTGTTLLSWPFGNVTSLIDSRLHLSITGAPTSAAADKVIVGLSTYFYKTTNPNLGWHLTTDTPATPNRNAEFLNPGFKAFYIQRAGAETTSQALEFFVP